MTSAVNYQALFEHDPGNYLVLAPDPPHFTMIAANEAGLRTMTLRREEVIGRSLFDILPADPAARNVKSVHNLAASLHSVVRSRKAHRMTVQRCAIRTPEGESEERWWKAHNSPVFDDHGNLIYIVHQVDDVTEKLRSGNLASAPDPVWIAAHHTIGIAQVATLVRSGTERKTAEQRSREEAQRFLAEAGLALASSLDYQETLERVAHLAVPRLADWCLVDLIEDGKVQQVTVAHADSESEEVAREYLRHYPPELDAPSGVAQVLRTGEPQLHSDVSEPVVRELARTEEEFHLLDEMGLRSAMIVPLVARGRTLGAITLVTAESERSLESYDLDIARELARRAALAVDNARLYRSTKAAHREAERRADQEVVFRDVARTLAIADELENVADQIAESAVEITPAFGAYIERVEFDENDVEVIAASGSGPPEVGTSLPYPGSLTEGIIESEKPHLLTETGRIGKSVAPYLAERCRACSGLVVPLIFEAEPLGALVLLRGAEDPHFDEAEVARAVTLGDLASIALRRVLLLEAERQARGEAERRTREERALLRATEAVTNTYTVDEVIQKIAQNALAATNADAALVECVDIERGKIEVAGVAGDRVLPLGARVKFVGSLAERVIERQEPELITNLAEADSGIISELVQCCSDHSALVVPLMDAGKAIGVLILLREPEKWTFREDEIQRSQTFANLAALAFRKVHLLEASERGRKDLERVMASRTRLMSGFSHDVKNPLGAADGSLQLMEEGILDPLTSKQEEGVERARKSLRTALRLIEDLLELARAEAGEIEVQWTAVDMRDAVREIAEEHRAQAEGKSLTFSIETPDKIPIVHSDADRIRQILGNLLSNAIKYTEQGGVTVRVVVRAEAEAAGRDGEDRGHCIVVDVVDTGPGISEDEQQRLFQEFERLEATSGEEGAGVGLAISHRVADALGGGITVESEVGKGSTFTLWIPVERDGR